MFLRTWAVIARELQYLQVDGSHSESEQLKLLAQLLWPFELLCLQGSAWSPTLAQLFKLQGMVQDI